MFNPLRICTQDALKAAVKVVDSTTLGRNYWGAYAGDRTIAAWNAAKLAALLAAGDAANVLQGAMLLVSDGAAGMASISLSPPASNKTIAVHLKEGETKHAFVQRMLERACIWEALQEHDVVHLLSCFQVCWRAHLCLSTALRPAVLCRQAGALDSHANTFGLVARVHVLAAMLRQRIDAATSQDDVQARPVNRMKMLGSNRHTYWGRSSPCFRKGQRLLLWRRCEEDPVQHERGSTAETQ